MRMLNMVKKRMGIHGNVKVYDDELQSLIEDAKLDMLASGVPETMLNLETYDERAINAVACYVKANFGNDRSDSDRYMDMYLKKTFRLTLEDDEDVG